jgi:hypothetical protein
MSVNGSQAEILAEQNRVEALKLYLRRISSSHPRTYAFEKGTNVGGSVIFMIKVRADDMRAQSFAGLKHHHIDFQHSSASGYALTDRVLFCPTAMDKFGWNWRH